MTQLNKDILRYLHYIMTFSEYGIPVPIVNKDELGLHSIDVSEDAEEKSINVNISLSRPGIIIGKKGTTINAIHDGLVTELVSRGYIFDKLDITLTEFNLWKDMYN